MIGFIARLSRSIPLIIALVVLALIIYFVVSYTRTPTRAKEILIRVFTVLCAVLTGLFVLISLYAIVDGNQPVLELAASFAVVALLGLLITRFCAWRFKKNHPHYAQRAQRATTNPDTTTVTRSTIFWKIYDLLGNFRPKN